MNNRLKFLVKQWQLFENICIDDNEHIDTDWLYWKKGTSRYDIWHWFDDELGKVSNYLLVDLMYNKIKI